MKLRIYFPEGDSRKRKTVKDVTSVLTYMHGTRDGGAVLCVSYTQQYKEAGRIVAGILRAEVTP